MVDRWVDGPLWHGLLGISFFRRLSFSFSASPVDVGKYYCYCAQTIGPLVHKEARSISSSNPKSLWVCWWGHRVLSIYSRPNHGFMVPCTIVWWCKFYPNSRQRPHSLLNHRHVFCWCGWIMQTVNRSIISPWKTHYLRQEPRRRYSVLLSCTHSSVETQQAAAFDLWKYQIPNFFSSWSARGKMAWWKYWSSLIVNYLCRKDGLRYGRRV